MLHHTRGRSRSGWARAALVATTLTISFAIPASATHSVPHDPEVFWDNDVDGIAEASDSIVRYQKGGGGWTTAKTNRVTEAFATWNNNTDFNPSLVASSVNVIYIDGSPAVACGWQDWSEPPPGTIAVNCVKYTIRGSYYQITNSKIYLNEVQYSFSWATGTPASGLFDGRGIVTHETGHSVLLVDLYGAGNCPPGPTMCGLVGKPESYNLRSLTTDDISAANSVYLP